MTRTASWATIGLLLAALVAPALLSAQVEESIRPLSACPRDRDAQRAAPRLRCLAG
jgi:hypothetical protein